MKFKEEEIRRGDEEQHKQELLLDEEEIEGEKKEENVPCSPGSLGNGSLPHSILPEGACPGWLLPPQGSSVSWRETPAMLSVSQVPPPLG